MPLFITTGRFTPDAVKGMLNKPEDRAEAVAKLFEQAGGKLLDYYMTFGDHDFLVISEGPLEGVATTTIVAEASGGVVDMKTELAMTSRSMKDAFEKAGSIAAAFKPAGLSQSAPSPSHH